jgi:putative flippase GtrA
MTFLTRWLRFNLVGAMGMGLQLTLLALFTRISGGHYLYASAAAIEFTLLHNFFWHQRFTWRDRQEPGSVWPRLLRFHLSNGMVSLPGNLVLMRLLVHEAHLPLLVANSIAILGCSLVNFSLSHLWSFAEPGHPPSPRPVTLGLLLCLACRAASAQTTLRHSHDLGTDCAYENIFVGPAVSAGGLNTRPSFLGGVTIGQYFARTLGNGVTASPQFELGVIGPLPGGYPLDGFVGFDLMFANKLPHRGVYPSFTAGYTRLFVTGNALNFGMGVDFGKSEFERLMRIEIRDYFLFTGPQQHVIALRIGIGKLIAD